MKLYIYISLYSCTRCRYETIYLYIPVLGVDMIDGTPILDVKPYIPIYDNPSQAKYELVIVLSIFYTVL